MEPRRLKARQGWEWIKQGYALFIKAPLLWIVLLFYLRDRSGGKSSVPVVGEPLVSLLMPAILVGLMVGCRALSQDEELELAHLFSGFKQHASQLVTLGGISLVGQLLIFGVMMMVGGATLVGILMSGQPDTDPTWMMQAVTGAGFAVFAWYCAVQLADDGDAVRTDGWCFFRNVPPVQAMKLSLRAFLHNVGPMLVYGITFLLLAILASLPMMLGWLVLLPLVFTSLYASYCDIFPPVKDASSTPPQAKVFNRDDQTFP